MSEPWSAAPMPGQHFQPPQPPAPSPPQGKRRLALVVAAAAVALLAAGGIGFALGRSTADPSPDEAGDAVAAQEQESRLQSAFDACISRDSDKTLTLEDDGATIVVDTGSEYGDPFGMNCVLSELDTPDSIQAQMGRTTAMQGVQDAEHDGIEYSWSYHPDNGVDMVITESRAAS